MSPETVPQMLALRAEQDPEREAVIVEGVTSMTFGEWDRRSDDVAHGLLDRGVRRGDRIGLLFGSRDWADFAVAYCAVQKTGAVAVPLSDRLAPAEVRHMLEHCSASALLCGRDLTPPEGDRWSAAVAELEGGTAGPPGVRVE
ncbi:AMP-binding protein, partial [Streptosporangium sp. NPDC006013]|uniref:AMP-binding protein n=1 Tax=Streptosporangium sp. NPDC006013 TaxID=3155596 RepID=UPI0033B29152